MTRWPNFGKISTSTFHYPRSRRSKRSCRSNCQRMHVALMLFLATIGWCFFIDILFRIICLELMEEDKENEKRYREFWMQLYCFPDPDDPQQRMAIRSIWSVENEMQAMYTRISDVDKLITCRRNVEDAMKSGIVGNTDIRSFSFRWGHVCIPWENSGSNEEWWWE